MMDDTQHPSPLFENRWGLVATVCGAIALCLVFAQMQLIMGQETASIGQQIGEIAGDIKRSAMRSLQGLPPPEPAPIPLSQRLSEIFFVAAPIAAGIAFVISAVSFVKREHPRLGIYGIVLAGSAILFQFVWWMAILVLGCLLLVKIVENIGDIFSFGA